MARRVRYYPNARREPGPGDWVLVGAIVVVMLLGLVVVVLRPPEQAWEVRPSPTPAPYEPAAPAPVLGGGDEDEEDDSPARYPSDPPAADEPADDDSGDDDSRSYPPGGDDDSSGRNDGGRGRGGINLPGPGW